MSNRISKIKNIRTITALRGDSLKIDLGIAYEGTLTAWMKKDPNDTTYREFDIEENRYLVLSREKTSDYYFENELKESIKGAWYFDVELQPLDSSHKETIYTGKIFFENDVTGSRGVQMIPVEEYFNIDGGSSGTKYLESQKIDLGNSINK